MPINSQPFSKQISRRAVLGTAAAFAATPAFAEGCLIGPPAHEKGVPVWMDMDQIELDAAYDQSVYAPLIGQILKRYASSSTETRARLGAPKRLAYGPTPGRSVGFIPRQDTKRADRCGHTRRRLAWRRSEGLRLSGGTFRQC